MDNKGKEWGKRVSPVQGWWVAMRILVFTAPAVNRLPAGRSSSSKMIQLLYSWLLQTMSERGRLRKCWRSCRTFPSLNRQWGWARQPVCVLLHNLSPTSAIFGRAGSPRQLDSSCGCSVRWQKDENGKIWPLFVMLFLSFFPCKGPHEYLENKRISRLKYQSNCLNADPSAGRG